METTPGDREHGYDDVVEEQAYQRAEEDREPGTGAPGEKSDPDAGPASKPDEVDRDQAEG
jgi:hypothetical protein